MATRKKNIADISPVSEAVIHTPVEAEQTAQLQSARMRITRRQPNLFAVACGVVVVVGLLYWFFNREQSIEERTREVTSMVEKHMLLPEELPAVFVIEDPALLSEQQPFFKGAEKGDTLLVYQGAQKAIIYSEKRDIIVNVGPVTLDEGSPALEVGQ